MTCQCGDPVYAEGYCGVCFGTFLINEGRTDELMLQLSEIAHVAFPPENKTWYCSSQSCRNKKTFREYCDDHQDERIAIAYAATGSILGTDRRDAEKIGDRGITVEELYERDGGVCGICGESVDQDLPSRDTGGPSIDHIVPLIPREWSPLAPGTHTWDNVQLAHLGCNLKKSNKTPQNIPLDKWKKPDTVRSDSGVPRRRKDLR